MGTNTENYYISAALQSFNVLSLKRFNVSFSLAPLIKHICSFLSKKVETKPEPKKNLKTNKTFVSLSLSLL